MAVASLRYDAMQNVEESKTGLFIFDGTPSRYHEWEFRSKVRWASVADSDKRKTMSMIIESLRGEAANVAMDIGIDELMEVGGETCDEGFNKLMAGTRRMVFPFARAEAKELFKVGSKSKGLLTRQPGESMSSFVSRRRRWWTKLRQMDDSIDLSSAVRGDLMLEAAGLSPTEQKLVLTSIGNSRDFDRLGEALIEQHSNIHLGERRKASPAKPKYPAKQLGYGKGRGHKPWRSAHYGDVVEDFDESDDETEDEDDSFDTSADPSFTGAFLGAAGTEEEEEAVLDTKDEVEMDVYI